MSDKDYGSLLPQIANLAQVIVFTMLEYERSARPEKLLKSLPADLKERAVCENALDTALARAAEQADTADLICIAGSLYMVGEARKLLLGEII